MASRLLQTVLEDPLFAISKTSLPIQSEVTRPLEGSRPTARGPLQRIFGDRSDTRPAHGAEQDFAVLSKAAEKLTLQQSAPAAVGVKSVVLPPGFPNPYLPSNPSNPTTPPSAPPPAAPFEPNGLVRLRAALQGLGIPTSGLNISYGEETVGYPGGSYVNRLITVSNGTKTEHFDVNLTATNPLVTAQEIRRYFNV